MCTCMYQCTYLSQHIQLSYLIMESIRVLLIVCTDHLLGVKVGKGGREEGREEGREGGREEGRKGGREGGDGK